MAAGSGLTALPAMPVYSVRVVAGKPDADGLYAYTADALPAVGDTIKFGDQRSRLRQIRRRLVR